MGAKPSRSKVRSLETASESTCLPPKQEVTASAPPTPEHPEGAPRPQEEEDCFPPGAVVEPESPIACRNSRCLHAPERGPARQTHDGVTTWPSSQSDANNGDSSLITNAAKAAVGSQIDFSASLDQVLELATEAFGSMATALSSPSWDRRVQALKGVGTVLKGLDLGSRNGTSQPSCRGLQLRDGARCFRAACLVLNVALRDKVLPVQFAAHALFRITVDLAHGTVPEEEGSFAISTLTKHVINKLGEVNIRLHECACTTFVHAAGRFPKLGVFAVFDRLQEHLDECPARGQQRMRVHAGVLDALGLLLRRFPARHIDEGDEADAASAWSASDVASFVLAGMHVDPVLGIRVQQATASLVVTVYTTLGKRGLDTVMEGLADVPREFILQKVSEETGMLAQDLNSDDEGEEFCVGEDMPLGSEGLDLCVTGVAIKPPNADGKELIAKTDGREESYMDEILEETGLVFNGRALDVPTAVKGGTDEDSILSGILEDELRGLGLLEFATGTT